MTFMEERTCDKKGVDSMPGGRGQKPRIEQDKTT